MAEDIKKTLKTKKNPNSDFHAFFTDKIKPKLAGFEQERKKFLMITIIVEVIVCLGILIYYYLTYRTTHEFTIGNDCCIFVAIPAIAYAIPKIYKTKVKKLILPLILSYIGDFKCGELNINLKEMSDFYAGLNMFPKFNKILIDDYITGKYKNLDLRIVEIKLEQVSVHHTRKGSRTSSKTQFNGICFNFKNYKKAEKQTVVLLNSKKPNVQNLNKVNLEDPEFERYFDVYSGDQIESRSILTPAYMNRMVTLAKNKSQIVLNMSTSFTGDDVCMSIKSDKDWFEVPILKPVDDYSNYKSILKDLSDILSIIDTLKYTD